jgi:hypothetical protein
VEVYNPAADTWIKKADMLTGRSSLSTSMVNGYIYAIGGAPRLAGDAIPALSDVEAYDTGFRPTKSINMKEKLPTMWGRMKAE